MTTVIHQPPPGGTVSPAVRGRPCPLCGTPAGEPCQPKPSGDHLARFLAAYTAGQLTRAYMAMAVGELVVIDTCAVIPARPEPVLGALLAAGHTLTYEPEVTGGWFALLRTGDGRLVENGNGPTKADALAHLTDRLERAR